jgi:2-polyprenyl-3-methyl-5-hydroxy-6-metoxy-1,4-benzoquinol methylase
MPEGAKGTASDVYVLDVGESGAARLRLLDQVYGTSTRRMLIEAGLREGSRVLDLACGIGAVSCWLASQVGATGKVIAGDVNPDQLVIAKGIAQIAIIPLLSSTWRQMRITPALRPPALTSSICGCCFATLQTL